MVKKAIVLAAGMGTRLRPLTAAVPKPLLPVWGVPMLERVVDLLRGWGVEDIVVNCHYLHEQVEAWCAANGCRASYEPEVLGTGGVLNPLREWIGNDDFLLVNGDIVIDGIDKFPFREIRETRDEIRDTRYEIRDKRDEIRDKIRSMGVELIGQCVVSGEDGPRTIEAEPEAGLVTCWKSPDPGYYGTYTYCGIALLKPAILDYVEPQGFSTIVQAYDRAMMDGKFMKSVVAPDLIWADAGTIESFIEINSSDGDNGFAELPQIGAVGGINEGSSIEFIGARGSDRAFFKGDGKVFVIYDDAKRAENARYAGHARWLKAQGIPVPGVLNESAAMKTIALEDAGSTDLLAMASRPGADKIAAYAPVVEALARFNALECDLELEPAFGPELWKWERDLFKEHCLGSRFRMECPEAVEKELEQVAEILDREPKALVHRDFQSTNVIWKNGEFKFIDFQGMRQGPAAYDLASLLYDPYIRLSEKEREALAALYMKVSASLPRQVAPSEGVLAKAAVQRLVQALGAYGRLASVGKSEFSKYVMPALENLLAAADEAGLDAVGALAEDLIAKERSSHEHHKHHHCHH